MIVYSKLECLSGINMIRSEIHESKYRPHFTGHETFPLKYGWLKKPTMK